MAPIDNSEVMNPTSEFEHDSPYLLSLFVRNVMLLKHCHAVLKVLDDVRRRLVGLAKGERHGGELPRATRERTVHLRNER